MTSLNVAEAFCYICRGVLIEPVTLPCFHVFCLICLEKSMQETSYSCPLCRRWISNWVRSAKKSNNLVNKELWRQIREQFGKQVQLKLKDEDDQLDQLLLNDSPVSPSTSKPGEVAQEFSKLLTRFKNEKERLRAEEELASKELIMKIQEQDKTELKLFKESNDLQIKEDSMLAMKIQEEINMEACTVPARTRMSFGKRARKFAKKNFEKGSFKGPLDGFVKASSKSPKHPNDSSSSLKEKCNRSTSADSTDSIRLETNLFQPIKKVLKTPPKQYPDGRVLEIKLTRVIPLTPNFNNLASSSSVRSMVQGKKIRSTHSAFVGTNSPGQETGEDYESPSKRLKFSSDETDSGVLKDITLEENNDSNSSTIAQDDLVKKKPDSVKKLDKFIVPSKCGRGVDVVGKDDENDNFKTQDYLNHDSSSQEKLIEEQRRIEKIIVQEKEDRKLALRLSREWELEAKEKPQTRSAYRKTRNVASKKTQQTLMECIASRTRNRQNCEDTEKPNPSCILKCGLPLMKKIYCKKKQTPRKTTGHRKLLCWKNT